MERSPTDMASEVRSCTTTPVQGSIQIAPRERKAGSATSGRNCTRHALIGSVGGFSTVIDKVGLAACAIRMISSGGSCGVPFGEEVSMRGERSGVAFDRILTTGRTTPGKTTPIPVIEIARSTINTQKPAVL